MEDIVEEEVARLKALPITEQVALLAKTKDELTLFKEAKTQKQKYFDLLRMIVLPESMEEQHIDSINTKDGHVVLVSDLRAFIPAANRDAAQEWLEENGYGDLVKPTVNASSLKALAKELLKKGITLPEEIFNINAFTRANIKVTR